MSKVEPLSKAENEEMRDFALSMAISKLRLLGTVAGMFRAAEQQIDSYMRCMNTYVQDPELDALREKIRKLSWSVPDHAYVEKISQAIGSIEPGRWDYGEPNDEYRARLRDMGKDPHGEDDYDGDIPFVDPIEMYKKKKTELEGGK